MDDERVSAMSAAMLSLGERIGLSCSRGSIDRIYVEGNKGKGMLISCGGGAVLLVLARETANQELLILKTKRVLTKLKKVSTLLPIPHFIKAQSVSPIPLPVVILLNLTMPMTAKLTMSYSLVIT